MGKRLAAALLLIVIAGAVGYFWMRPAPASTSLACFASLPPDFHAAWQVDLASLRGFLPARPFLGKLKLDDADRVCGVLTPESKTAIEGRAPAIPESAEKTLKTWDERQYIPPGSQGWLVARKLDQLPRLRAIEISSDTTIELPGEVMSAKWAVASIQAGAVSVALVVEAEYRDDAEAQRAASGLRGFLGLVKNVARRTKSRAADQALQSALSSAIVETEGPRVFLKASSP